MKVFLNMLTPAQTGYGYYCESYKRILKKLAEDGKIELKMIYSYMSKEQYEKFTEEEKEYVKDLKTIEDFDISISIGSPDIITHPQFFNVHTRYDIIATVFESPLWPRAWIFPLKGANIVFVPSFFNATALTQNHGVPAAVIPHPIEYKEPTPFSEIDEIRSKKKFLFGYVGDIIFRKNIEGTIKAFIEAFKNNTEVALVIKTYPSRSEHLKNIIVSMKREMNVKYPSIYIIDKMLTENELSYFYEKINVFVSTTRGEGFFLPMYEAISHGKVVIAPDHTAIKDFIKEGLLTYSAKPFQVHKEHLQYAHPNDFLRYFIGSILYEPNYNEFKDLMMKVYKDPLPYIKEVGNAKAVVENVLSYDNITDALYTTLETIYDTINEPIDNKIIVENEQKEE